MAHRRCAAPPPGPGSVRGAGRGAGRSLARTDPGYQAHANLPAMGYAGFGANDPAGGRAGQAPLAAEARAADQAVGPRARVVDAVGLWRGADHRWRQDRVVLRVACLVQVPGRGAVAREDAAVVIGLDRTLRRIDGVPIYALTDNRAAPAPPPRDDSINKAIAKLIRADLVVIDDVGLLPVSADAAEALFRVIDAAYEKRSIAVSSNIHPSGSTS